MDGRRQAAGPWDDEGHIGALAHGLKPLRAEMATAHRPDLPIAGLLHQALDHTADDADLQTEEHHHGSQHSGQGQDKTAGHLPLMGVIPEGKS